VIAGLVVTVVVAASTVLSLSCDSSQRSGGELAFDWKRGTYEGVRLGDRTAELRRVLGSPVERGASQPFEPIGENEGTEYATYPLCRVRVCAGRLLGFGGEPIRSIWLAAETKRALTRCREP